MRGPPPTGNMGPGGPPGGMSPMSMPGGQGNRPWPPNSSQMSYSSPSPGNFNGPPGGGPPGTPGIMPSPQDSSNSGESNMYGMMKPNMPGNMGGFPPMGGPEGSMGPMGPDMPQVMNGESMADSMKSSPHNGSSTPREDMPPVSGPPPSDMPTGYNIPYQDPPVNPDQTDTAAILKIKESMEEEAKRFEKDTPTDPTHPEYFMQ